MTATICLRKILFTFLFSILLLFFASSTLAVDATPSSATATTRKELAQQKIDMKRASVSEKIASKEAALKAKLEKFRNKEKAVIAERVSMNLNKINEKMTLEMSKFLERVSTLLSKLEARVNQGSPNIKDVKLAKEAIASASASIKTAEAAVSAQAEKDYTITVTSEAKVKTDANNMRKQLHTDLQTVRKLVIEAKQAVGNAIRVAKSGKKVSGVSDAVEEATASGQ